MSAFPCLALIGLLLDMLMLCRGYLSCPLCLQEAAKPSVLSAAEKAGQASTSSNVSSPHSVWTSFPDAVESGASNSNAGAAEAAAAAAQASGAAELVIRCAGKPN